MNKRILVVNGILVCVCLLLSYSLGNMYFGFRKYKGGSPQGILSKKNEPEKAPVADNVPSGKKRIEQEKRVPVDYSIVPEKSLFRPERKEWKPPPPPPPKEEKLPSSPPAKRTIPLPDLFGTVVAGRTKVAIMQGYTRESDTPRFKEVIISGRRTKIPLPPVKGKLVKDKMKRYYVGDVISDVEIVDIKRDRVFVKDEGQTKEIQLKSKEVKELDKQQRKEQLTPTEHGPISTTGTETKVDERFEEDERSETRPDLLLPTPMNISGHRLGGICGRK